MLVMITLSLRMKTLTKSNLNSETDSTEVCQGLANISVAFFFHKH